MKNILVISPHPDDESIGCGGTIRKHISEGDNVQVIFLTSGEKGGHGKSEDETIVIRENEATAAAAILQISKIDFWKEPDGKFQPSEKNVNRLLDKIKTFQPNIIFVPHNDEEHPDHRAAAQLVSNALDVLSLTIEKPLVLMYEVWTPIQKMDHIVDISDYINEKRNAIRAHKSQCDVLKFDEAILGLNRYRGEMHSWPGGDYAEVFKTL
jgi:LmbE family N-acetylglucosaminyl deacetylase